MADKAYTYNVAPEIDDKAFRDVCALIESQIPNIEEKELLIDVDDTQIQIYKTPHGEIVVLNDYEVGAVYVDSDVNLDKILK